MELVAAHEETVSILIPNDVKDSSHGGQVVTKDVIEVGVAVFTLLSAPALNTYSVTTETVGGSSTRGSVGDQDNPDGKRYKGAVELVRGDQVLTPAAPMKGPMGIEDKVLSIFRERQPSKLSWEPQGNNCRH